MFNNFNAYLPIDLQLSTLLLFPFHFLPFNFHSVRAGKIYTDLSTAPLATFYNAGGYCLL